MDYFRVVKFDDEQKWYIKAKCHDSRGECSNWAKQGECNNNPGYMK